MSAVQVDDTTRAGWALLALNTHGSADRIADHLLEHGYHGDHHTDTCPLSRYLRAQTGLNVTVGLLRWHLTNQPTPRWHHPEHVQQFLHNFDSGHYPDLTTTHADVVLYEQEAQ